MKKTPLILLAWLLQTTAPGLWAVCVPSGNQTDINNALSAPGTVVELCANAVFTLTAPILFSQANQEIRTEGLPTGDSRAVLRIGNASVETAVNGLDRAGVKLRNVMVDGARPILGRAAGNGPLILLGGDVAGQVVENVKAFESRGWTHIHIYEGAGKNCSGAAVVNNAIGPAGPLSEGLTDGISVACRDSLVSSNTITDVSDGGIVVFQAPGTEVSYNTVRVNNNILLGGINLVDYTPYDGDFTGTVVKNNVIDAAGGRVKTGIAMGPPAWACNQPFVNRNGTVKDNLVKGPHMGYGFVANGVTGWTATGNVSQATHNGTPGLGCGSVSASPAAFLKSAANAQGAFQSEFVNASPLDNVINMNPSTTTRLSPNATTLSAGTSEVTLTWTAGPSGASYNVRAEDLTDAAPRDSRNTCAGNPHYLCVDGVSATSISLAVQTGHLYKWWVHTVVAGVPGAAEEAGFYVATAGGEDFDTPTGAFFQKVYAYPSPSRGPLTFYVRANGDEPVQLDVYTVSGRRVHHMDLDPGVAQTNGTQWIYNVSWDAGRLASGVYVLTAKAESANAKAAHKFIIVK